LLSERPIEHTDSSRGTSRRVGLVGVGGLATLECAVTETGDAEGVPKYGDEPSGRGPREPEIAFEVRLERVVRRMSVPAEDLAIPPRVGRRGLSRALVFPRAVLTAQPETDDRDGQLRQPTPGWPIIDEPVAPQRGQPELRPPTQVLVAKPPDGRVRR